MLRKFTSISEVRIEDHFPSRKTFSREAIVLYDSKLKIYPFFKKWLKNFEHSIPLNGGESLKSIESFSKTVKATNTLTRPYSKNNLEIIAVGGGSVGDLVGFMASVLKRGVQHIQIPTTWLAAIDSAHGGKNGLNISGAKNQLGTFYPAKAVYIVKEVLWPQPSARAFEALSELIKIGFIKGGRWTNFLQKQMPRVLATPLRIEVKHKKEIRLREEAIKQLLWENIPHAIQAKGSIVLKDPFEKIGPRRVLNFGHTLGHILEAHFQWPHGVAIAEGLRFAIEWSRERAYLAPQHADEYLFDILSILPYGKAKTKKALSKKVFIKLLLLDKKTTERQKIAFIFLRKFGKPFIKEVSASEIVKEAERQGWIRK